jgi:hypothetical protein
VDEPSASAAVLVRCVRVLMVQALGLAHRRRPHLPRLRAGAPLPRGGRERAQGLSQGARHAAPAADISKRDAWRKLAVAVAGMAGWPGGAWAGRFGGRGRPSSLVF